MEPHKIELCTQSTNRGNSSNTIRKPTNTNGNWVTPFEIDPTNHNWIYSGFLDLYRHENGGTNGEWINLSKNIDFSRN